MWVKLSVYASGRFVNKTDVSLALSRRKEKLQQNSRMPNNLQTVDIIQEKTHKTQHYSKGKNVTSMVQEKTL